LNYILDTNAAIAVINGSPGRIRKHLKQLQNDGASVAVSSIVLFELWYGVANSNRWTDNAAALRAFLKQNIAVLSFDEEDARAAGELRATLEQAATQIGAYDLLIAAQALRRNITLVTANTREFARAKGLLYEDWSLGLD